MPEEVCNCWQTQVDLFLISLPFTEVCYCVYTIKNFTSVKLKQNQADKHLLWKHGKVAMKRSLNENNAAKSKYSENSRDVPCMSDIHVVVVTFYLCWKRGKCLQNLFSQRLMINMWWGLLSYNHLCTQTLINSLQSCTLNLIWRDRSLNLSVQYFNYWYSCLIVSVSLVSFLIVYYWNDLNKTSTILDYYSTANNCWVTVKPRGRVIIL